MNAIVVSGSHHTTHQFLATANCFFFPSMNIENLFRDADESLNEIAVRPGRVEVSDLLAPLHSHDGFTVAFVASGYGKFKTIDLVHSGIGEIFHFEKKEYEIRAGDVLLIPPNVLHLSIAAPKTTMVEHSIFIGNPQSFDAIEE